ncbi:MAG: YezD family protein [Methylococcaceae bacterium]
MAADTKKHSQDSHLSDIAKQIAVVLQGIRFGSVEITIHDNKVVQIERKEKLRFNQNN